MFFAQHQQYIFSLSYSHYDEWYSEAFQLNAVLIEICSSLAVLYKNILGQSPTIEAPSSEGRRWENRVGWVWGPLPIQLGWRSILSSPGMVRGRAPNRNAFWRMLKAQNALFCTYMAMFWVRQTVFHVTFGGKAELWGHWSLPQCITAPGVYQVTVPLNTRFLYFEYSSIQSLDRINKCFCVVIYNTLLGTYSQVFCKYFLCCFSIGICLFDCIYSKIFAQFLSERQCTHYSRFVCISLFFCYSFR